MSEQQFDTQVRRKQQLLRALLEQYRNEHQFEAKIPRLEQRAVFPLSSAQRRLWFIDQLDPGLAAFNTTVALILHGPVDVESLARSFAAITQRHEILRTTFLLRDGQPVQHVHATITGTWHYEDLRSLEPAQREKYVAQVVREERCYPFDLAIGPLARYRLLQQEEELFVLTITLHHCISDRWSTSILLRDLALCYNRMRMSAAPDLPALSIQYGDYASWQQEQLQTEMMQTHCEYWKNILRPPLPLLELPTYRRRPVRQTYRGARRTLSLPGDLLERVQKCALEAQCTPFVIWLSAYAVLLYRYSGQAEVIIGTPVSNRSTLALEDLIGNFTNNLVLPIKLQGTQTFFSLVKSVREQWLQALSHSDFPFEKMVEIAQPERSLSHAPLFQTSFIFQNTPPLRLALTDIDVSIYDEDIGATTSKYDLSVEVDIAREGGLLTIEYSTDLFDTLFAERLANHFLLLLREAVTHPETPISILPLLSEVETAQIVEQWNDTHRDYRPACLHHLVEAQTARTPDRIALQSEAEQITFKALDCWANKQAQCLIDSGVRPETLVAVLLERSCAMVVALLAILKAGGGYVPLDPEYPTQRIATILQDARPHVVLTTPELAVLLPREVPVLFIVDPADISAAPQVTSSVTAASIAYVLYTSGSTGVPKGAMNTHANICNKISWSGEYYTADIDEYMLCKTNYCFDVSVWEIFWPLSYGISLVIAPPRSQGDPFVLQKLIRERAVTMVHFVPPMLAQFVNVIEPGACATLKHIFCSGDILHREIQDRVFARLPHVHLHNLYGPTETAVDVSSWDCREENEIERVPIGFAIANCRLYILDPLLQPVPIGVVGELYIGGKNVGRGYLHRPDLTAERFLPDPFSGKEGERLYRTGDLVRWRPDGAVEFLQRSDFQVKIRGFRVELGEIEEVLHAHPAVERGIALAVSSGEADKSLAVYILLRAGATLTAAEVHQYLAARLPSYMLPAFILFLDELPLTASGKIARERLPDYRQAIVFHEQQFLTPETAFEQDLAAIWSEVLGISQVGREGNFFALGGDSIKAIQIVAKARERHLDVSLQDLFQYKTLRELASVVQNAEQSSEPMNAFALVREHDRVKLPAAVCDAYPPTMLQLGMLLDSLYDPESIVYIESFSYTFTTQATSEVRQEYLFASVREIMRLHPILRTSFALHEFSEPLQLVHQDVPLACRFDDLRGLSAEEQEQRIAQRSREDLRGFDWRYPPLFRLSFFQLTDQTVTMLIVFHHAILDGWSLTIFLKQLLTIYGEIAQGAYQESEPLPVSFRDYVVLEQQSIALPEARRYWADRIAGGVFTRLPRWPFAPQRAEQRYQAWEHEFEAEMCQAIYMLSQELNIPVKSVLLAAHIKVLAALTDQQEVVTGVMVHGRPEVPGGDQLIGLFLNMPPLYLALPKGSWRDLFMEVFLAERALLPFARYPLAEIRRQAGGRELFEVAFNYIHFHSYRTLPELAQVTWVRQYAEETPYQLFVYAICGITQTHFSLKFIYDSWVLHPEQITALGRYYQNVVSEARSDLAAPHSSFSLVPKTLGTLSFEQKQALLAQKLQQRRGE